MVEPVTINIRFFARDIQLPQEQVQAVVSLLDEGFPVPFIARYRKDQTGNLDEDVLRFIDEELKATRTLCERKQAILKTIDSLGKLTPELDKKIREAKSAKRLEDLYLPFKPKRQTLASAARESGLEPLALEILEGKVSPEKLDERASEFINEDKKIKSVADAILGAGHIIAETMSEKIELIQQVREFVHRSGKLITAKIETKTEPKTVPAAPAKPKKEKKPRKRKEKTEPVVAAAETPEPVTETAPPVEEIPPVIETQPALEAPPVVETPSPEEAGVSAQLEDDDHSGAGGGDGETVTPEPEPTSEPEPGPVVPANDSESPGAQVPALDGVQAVTEQFQEWKAAQEEKGTPVVRSQKQLEKKKKADKRAEEKKKTDDFKQRQKEHFERQFSDYFEFSAGIRHLPPHRVLAINRGERAKVLRVKFENDENAMAAAFDKLCVPEEHLHADFLRGCLKDALHRLVVPAIEREYRTEMTEHAENQAIHVYARNLRNLLLQRPLYRKRVLALDPGYKHGCKTVALDEFGNVLGFETVYLSGGSVERRNKAVAKIAEMIEKCKITVIAIGNGTGCRDAEDAVAKMIAGRFADGDLSYIIVNEAGASVYSASPAAKEEFPNYDVLLRGAISIGRRLQDPLNELVKIDPASLGVGMYQHDLKGKHLKDTLTAVVESCVNHVGVDVNTATPAILRYVSGLNQLTAKRIYDYRVQNGPFRCREDLKKVSGIGEVAFMHAVGFLKIPGGSNPLDATWIHPESYGTATKVLEKIGFAVDDLRHPEKVKEITEKCKTLNAEELAKELGTGPLTIKDILENLARPGRDPRETLPVPIFKKGILKLEDLTTGMELTGTILNVVDFGAFVDIGLHDSGLIHISHMADRYIRDAHERVSVGDIVRVWVVEVDQKRKRISLTLIPPGTERPRPEPRRDERGERPPRPERDVSKQEPRPPRQDRPPRPQGQGQDRPPRPQGQGQGRLPRPDQGQHPPRPEGDRARRDDRGRDNRNRDRFDRERTPKTFVAAPKEKAVKPISEEMKKGKEPLRSFGDLAQLFGRVQVADPAEETKKKKEEERQQREAEQNETMSVAPAPPLPEPAPPLPEGENQPSPLPLGEGEGVFSA